MAPKGFFFRRLRGALAQLVSLLLLGTLPPGLRAQNQLEILQVAADRVAISWASPTFHLERADTLAGPASWSAVAEAPTELNGRLVLTVEATQAAAYFRLSRAAGELPPDPATIAPPLPTTQPTAFANATAFLFTGPDPVQTGVTPGAIVAERACVVRGAVR
ncbi:MAG: hypothetical protein R6V74_03360, partial [Lutibacter sp.]